MSRLVDIVDTTTRDGNQSLWSATGLITPDVLSIAPMMDRVGFHALDFTSSTHMAVSVRFHQEDPAATFDNPHGKIIINDGRNHLLMTQHRYDMITVDPAPPIWGVGMVNLHTQEFFELARDRLTDGGVMLMWALSNERDDFLRILAAYRRAFPYVTVFKGAYYTAFHLLGSTRPIHIDRRRAEAIFALPAVRADVNEIVTGQLTVQKILDLEVAGNVEVDEAIKGIDPLTDDHPTLEYRFLRGFTPRPFEFPSTHRRP